MFTISGQLLSEPKGAEREKTNPHPRENYDVVPKIHYAGTAQDDGSFQLNVISRRKG